MSGNISGKNKTLVKRGETSPGLFMSPDISREINKLIQNLTMRKFTKLTDSVTKVNEPSKSALNHYNKMYCSKYLHFEEIIFSKEMAARWYSIQYYACVPCGKRFKMKIEFMEHLDKNHTTLVTTKDNKKFDCCTKCATLWYKDEGDSVDQKHCVLSMHRYLTESNDFTVRPLPVEVRNVLKHVQETVADLIEQSNNPLIDTRSNEVIDALNKTLRPYYSSKSTVKVHRFGSRSTGLALQSSDLDIYLDFGKECTKAELIESRSRQIERYLHADSEVWETERILRKTRTPIIKLRHRSTGLQCDISFANSLAVENSKLIRSFNDAYPPCKELILFLKKWMSLWNLDGFDGITNYALTWLVIFYLQVEYKIPSIAVLIENHSKSEIICGWQTGVGDTIVIDLPKLPIRKLLLGFFDYYSNFDYMHSVVCPLLGHIYDKQSFTEMIYTKDAYIPKAMRPYVAQLKGPRPEYFRIDSSMCVQDPFDLSHNLTKAVKTVTLKCFRQYCYESASILRQDNTAR